MSNFEYLQVKDVRVNFADTKPVYGLSVGSQAINREVYNASSFSNSSVFFNCPPPSFTSILDRAILFHFEVILNFTGADQGSPLLKLGTADAVRQFPILSCCNSIQAQINNQSISIQPNQWINRLTQYMDLDERQLTMTANMPDQYQSYADYVTEGANRNPLGYYGDVVGQLQTRSSEPFIEVVSNTNTAAQVKVRVSEFMPISPFLAYGLNKGLQYLNSLSFTFSFADLTRIWSHSSTGNTISTITAVLSPGSVNPPYASMTWLTSDASQENLGALIYPRVYDYNGIERYTSTVGAINAGSTTQITSSAITLPVVPKKIYLFAKQQLADESYLTSDVNARINSISVNWAGQISLSQAKSQDLYQISVKNGNKQTFAQWYKYQGSVLCLSWGDDIPMVNPDDYPGRVRQTTFQVTMNLTNPSSQNRNYDIVMVVVYPGMLILSATGGTNLVQGFEPASIRNVDVLPVAKQFELENEPVMIGGGFWGSLWKGVRGIGQVVGKVAPALAMATGDPRLAAIGTAANLLTSDGSLGDKLADAAGLYKQTYGGMPIGGSQVLAGASKKDVNTMMKLVKKLRK